MKTILTILFLSFLVNSYAQYPRVDIPGSQVRKITSSIVDGQEYELQILLPGSYGSSNKKYPVVYLMDSQWDFPLVKSIYGQQLYDKFIPEMIIVGITWGGTKPNYDSLRIRDYSPTHHSSVPQSGGADKFLSFMKNELFPFIESSYPADSANRIMMGCSFGGLVTLYAMFSQPKMFSGYVAASPYTGWDNQYIYKFEKDYFQSNSARPVKLYLTVGDVEPSKPGFEKFVAHLASRNYSAVSIQSKVLENTGHSGTKSETFGRGLQFYFQKKK